MPGPSGIRGVTIDDVADVANNGSSAMRGGYTFTRSTRAPRPTPVMSTNVQDLLSGLLSTPLNTAGKKYSGYPTASAQEAAVLGSLVPFYAMGDYARQLAEQNLVDLAPEAGRRAEARSTLAESSAQQLAEAQAQVDAIKAGQQFVGDPSRLNLTPIFYNTSATVPIGPQGFRPTIPEEDAMLAQAQANRDLAAYGAAMAARNKYAFAQPTVEYDPTSGQYVDVVTPRETALLNTAETDIRNMPAYQTGVAPMEQLAQDIEQIPRYELAQKMAVEYFGMDPALAAGTFTPQVDVDYMDMMADYQTAQNLAAGIDPNASTEDILLRLDPSGQRLADYQEQIAAEAERKAFEGARNAEEEAFDLNLEVSTGFNVKQAAGTDFALSTARGYLNDANFIASVNKAIDTMKASEVMTASDRKRVADSLAAQYLENQKDDVGARILLNILYGFEFVTPVIDFSLD